MGNHPYFELRYEHSSLDCIIFINEDFFADKKPFGFYRVETIAVLKNECGFVLLFNMAFDFLENGKHHVVLANGSLNILSLLWSDEGYYACALTDSNNSVLLSRRATVRIASQFLLC